VTEPADRSLLEAADELARFMGAIALQSFRGGIAVERKADGSPVTGADRAAERAAREWLEQRFPGDAVLGEEFGEDPGTSGRQWLLDPIDGTRTFVRGVPLWGSLVTVVEGDEVLAGAASYAAVNQHLSAAPGLGCWHNGARCHVSAVADLADALVLTTDPMGFSADQAPGWGRVSEQAGLVRTWGDCYGYLLVATGRAEVMVDPRLNRWDAGCFIPILGEAGGRFTDWSGRSHHGATSGVATNGALDTPVRRLLAPR